MDEKEKDAIIEQSQKLNRFYKYLVRMEKDLDKLEKITHADKFSDVELMQQAIIRYECLRQKDEDAALYNIWKSITTIRALINGLETGVDSKMLEIMHSIKEEYYD